MWKCANETPAQRYLRMTRAFGNKNTCPIFANNSRMLLDWDDWYEERNLWRPYGTNRDGWTIG